MDSQMPPRQPADGISFRTSRPFFFFSAIIHLRKAQMIILCTIGRLAAAARQNPYFRPGPNT
jgi:hypothetical protein